MTLPPAAQLPAPGLSLAALLRGRRHQAGLTIEQLAERSWVSVRAIGNMERGESLGPQRKTVEALAEALGLVGPDRERLLSTARAGRRRMFDPAPSALALPRAVADFIGRATETTLLRELADDLDGTRSAVVVISGAPGVGKTALAVQASTAFAHRFPDGQYFLDLRGLEEQPVEPAAALGRLIRVLDPTLVHLPAGLDEQSAVLRGLVSQRRAVVVLDSAAGEAQLRPLLPATGRCLFMITSRRLLSGLEGVHRIRLGPLSGPDATALLDGLAGGRPDVDPAELRHLASIAEHLPLALRIIGNRLATRPEWNPERLVRHLSDERCRLHTLVSGDLAMSTAFASSYRQLSAPARTLFRRFSLIPGRDTGLAMARVLADRTVADTEDALDELVEAGLVETAYSGRYRLHDLLRLFAARRLEDEEPPQIRASTDARLTSWLLDTATLAAHRFDPAQHAGPDDPSRGVDLRTAPAALSWLTEELENWLGAVRAAGGPDRDRDEQVLQLGEAMHWCFDRVPHWDAWVEIFSCACAAAERCGDQAALSARLNDLSWAFVRSAGDAQQAVVSARRAYGVALAAGDCAQQGWARAFECQAHLFAESYEQALGPAREAYELFVRLDDEFATLQALAWVGRCLHELGRDDEAAECHSRRLQLATKGLVQDASLVATAVSARTDMSRLHARQGLWHQAVDDLEPVDLLARPTGFPSVDAPALHAGGHASCRTGRIDAGVLALRRARTIDDSTGCRHRDDAVDALIQECS